MEKVKKSKQKAYWWRENGQAKTVCTAGAARAGDRCPVCDAAELAYDGLFILSCPACGYIAESGAFT